MIWNFYEVPAADLLKQFRPAGKAKASRQHQLESLLETFSTLGLLRKTESGLYIK